MFENQIYRQYAALSGYTPPRHVPSTSPHQELVIFADILDYFEGQGQIPTDSAHNLRVSFLQVMTTQQATLLKGYHEVNQDPLLSGLRKLVGQHNGQVTVKMYLDFAQDDSQVPRLCAVLKRYGYWREALEQAGGTPVRERSRQFVVKDVAQRYHQLTTKLGRIPTKGDISTFSQEYDLPSYAWINTHWDMLWAFLVRLLLES